MHNTALLDLALIFKTITYPPTPPSYAIVASLAWGREVLWRLLLYMHTQACALPTCTLHTWTPAHTTTSKNMHMSTQTHMCVGPTAWCWARAARLHESVQGHAGECVKFRGMCRWVCVVQGHVQVRVGLARLLSTRACRRTQASFRGKRTAGGCGTCQRALAVRCVWLCGI